MIAKKERQYIGEVSKLLNTNPASTSITIEKLTIKQLVTRTYDRRKVHVSLTDFGRQEYNRLEEKKVIILQDLQSSLTEKEIMLINSKVLGQTLECLINWLVTFISSGNTIPLSRAI
ncbi:hypothetical protein HU823_19240 [Fictibacillus sp. 18YEL24]|nr:hypothetical protein [Fictibacillus sp. 18YEL24]